MMRTTSMPAISPACLVACRCASLKYAGTVMTALATFSPRKSSAAFFSLVRIIAEISGGLYSLPEISTRASSCGPLTTLYGTRRISSPTSSKRRPMKRLIEYTVFSGLVTACRLATCPTNRSPVRVMATTDGVVREPSWLGMTTGSPPCMTATTELVVPRSIPMILLIIPLPPQTVCRSPPRPLHSSPGHPGQTTLGARPAGPAVVASIQVECDLVKFSYIGHDGLYFQSFMGAIRTGPKHPSFPRPSWRWAVPVHRGGKLGDPA